MTARTSAKPRAPIGSARSRAKRTRKAEGRASPTAASSKTGADTRVEPGRDEIGRKRAENVEAGRQHDAAHDHWIVAGVERVEDQPPDARPREDDLGEDCSGDHVADAD